MYAMYMYKNASILPSPLRTRPYSACSPASLGRCMCPMEGLLQAVEREGKGHLAWKGQKRTLESDGMLNI